MIIKDSAIVAIAVREDQYPPEDVKEIAFAGRSNVGKSSLLNLLTGRRNLAKVSGNPGKTRTINFYNITAMQEEILEQKVWPTGPEGVKTSMPERASRVTDAGDSRPNEVHIGQSREIRFRIVDLPGYGYAKVSKSLSENWGDMIEAYLKNRKNLAATVLLLDIRRDPSAQDVQMYEWLRYYGLSGLLAITKADKVSASDRIKSIKAVRDRLKLEESDTIIPVSTLKKTGVEALLSEIEKKINT